MEEPSPTADAVGREVASRPPFTSRRLAWAAIIAIIVWATILFAKVLFGPYALFWHDASIQNIPFRLLVQQSFTHGSVPWWSWLLGSGYPLAADPQTHIAYPGQLLDLLPWLSAERIYAISAWLHVIVAGLGVWVLLAAYRLSPASRLLAALGYVGSGFFGGHVMHAHVLVAAAWLPWSLAGLNWIWRSPGVPRAIVGGMPLGLALLAGQPQFAFYSVVAYALWAFLAPLPEGSDLTRARAVGWGVFATVAGVVLGAAPYLAGHDLFVGSRRAALGAGKGGVFNMALDPIYWPLIVQPFLYGSYADNNYFGGAHHYEVCGYLAGPILALALFAIFAASSERRRLTIAFAVLAAAALFMAAARQNPLYHLFGHYPPLGSFRAHARWVMVFGLAASLLAALGVEAILLRRRLHVAAIVGGVLLLVWLAVPLAARVAKGPAIHVLASKVRAEASSPGAARAKAAEKYRYILTRLSPRDPYWAGCGFGALALLVASLAPSFSVGLALAVTALLGGLYFHSYLPAVPVSYYRDAPNTARAIFRDPGAVWVDPACPENLRPPPTYRGWAREGTGYYVHEREVLRPNRAVLWGIEAAQCNDPLTLGDQVYVLDGLVPSMIADARTRPAAYRLLASIGVRWAITLPDHGPPGAKPVVRTMQSALFEVPGAQLDGRLLAGRAQPCAGRVTPAAVELLRSPLDILVDDASKAGDYSGAGTVSVEREPGPEVMTVQVDAHQPSLLLLGIPDYTMLRASLDGSPATIVQYDGYLASVFVPAGKHTVRVRLDTSPVRMGYSLYLLAWLAALTAAASLFHGRP